MPALDCKSINECFGSGAVQETRGTGGYGAADAATSEVAQSLPRIRTSREEERPSTPAGGGAANGPTAEAKVGGRSKTVASA